MLLQHLVWPVSGMGQAKAPEGMRAGSSRSKHISKMKSPLCSGLRLTACPFHFIFAFMALPPYLIWFLVVLWLRDHARLANDVRKLAGLRGFSFYGDMMISSIMLNTSDNAISKDSTIVPSGRCLWCGKDGSSLAAGSGALSKRKTSRGGER